MFERWGRFVHNHRGRVLIGSFLLMAISIGGLLAGGTLGNGNSAVRGVEAARAGNLINAQLGSGKADSSTLLFIFSSDTLHVTDPAFRDDITRATAPLSRLNGVITVTTPYTAPAQTATGYSSKDGHQALVEVSILDPSGDEAYATATTVRDAMHPAVLRVQMTGNVPLNHAFNATAQSDLSRAELVTGPITLVLLLLIFGSLVAAGLPIGVGVATILAGIAGTLGLSHVTSVSIYALNIVNLIGLAVAIDYSLIIVSRFREELSAGVSREDALATTLATAGRAITFSGLTVAIGLSTMLFYQGTFLASMGEAGGVVVLAAVVYGLALLPALLAYLGPRVNRVSIPLAGRQRVDGRGAWNRIARWVMRRPIAVLLPAVVLLLAMGTPFLHLRLANAGPDSLPPSAEARQAFDSLTANFPGYGGSEFDVVVDYGASSPLTQDHIAAQYALAQRIGALPGVVRVESIYSAVPGETLAGYQSLYIRGAAGLPPGVRAAFSSQVGAHVMRITAYSSADSSSDAARTLLSAIRGQQTRDGGAVLVTGETAYDVDIINLILSRTPLAVTVVAVLTYLLLFLMTGSVVLPLKAVVLNLISISASFGALVWVFQDGHLTSFLGFTPQSVDPSVPVIMFAIVFGMSMDYEVFLVNRIQEEYVRMHDNTEAVALGLERSGRLITGAALIMVTVFLAFGLSSLVIIKAVGIGLAVAVALDATIVRALIVPAFMRLLGRANWWAPAALRRFHLAPEAHSGEPVASPAVSREGGVL